MSCRRVRFVILRCSLEGDGSMSRNRQAATCVTSQPQHQAVAARSLSTVVERLRVLQARGVSLLFCTEQVQLGF